MTDTLDQTQAGAGAGVAPDEELIARAAALVPLIREHAERSSAERRVVPEVVSALEDAGMFGLLVPERLGGRGATLRTIAVEALPERVQAGRAAQLVRRQDARGPATARCSRRRPAHPRRFPGGCPRPTR